MITNKCEISGIFLMGLIQAFENFSLLPNSGLSLSENILPTEWYPFSLLTETIKIIENSNPSDAILFQAGINFLHNWYYHGVGKELIFSSLDWIYANNVSGGYNTVVRGGDRDEIGWCDLQFFDEAEGIAIYDHVNPINGAFLKGIFYGGFTIFNDVDYIEVRTKEAPYPENPLFVKTVLTVYFKFRSKVIRQDLDEYIDNLKPAEALSLNNSETESIIWRYKRIMAEKRHGDQYNKQILDILSKSLVIIQDLSLTDGLTNLFNRRHFNNILQQTVNSAKRKNELVCLLIFDVDYFKQYNDIYGHQMGDNVLINLASTTIKNFKRCDDYCFRIGGEEFAVIFHTKRCDQAVTIAETFRQNIESLKIKHRDNKASEYVTVSIGLACMYGNDIENMDAIFKIADDLLYKAKQNGRNRVEAH